MTQLDGATLLITGTTGYIGGRLAERLMQETGAHVRALVRTPARAAHLAELGCELVIGDLTDEDSLARAVAGCTHVFHAGAWVSEHGRHADLWAVNVAGTANLVAAARRAGIERFIHLSSCAVYGSRQQFGIPETMPMRTGGSLYADSKVAAEEIVWQAHREAGLPLVVARPSQVYGLGSPQFTVRPIQMIRQGKLVLVDGGRHFCKPIYIDNLIDGLIISGAHGAAVGQTFNFTDGDPVTWRQFFGAYAAMLGKDRLPSAPRPLAWLVALLLEGAAKVRGREASLNRRVVRALCSDNSYSNQKAQQQLGWRPAVDLAEGMRRSERWLRQHGYLDDPGGRG